MNVSTLHTVTEDLAGLLSEVTPGDLGLPIFGTGEDVGDLYLSLVQQTLAAAAALAGPANAGDTWPELRSRADLAAVDVSGTCGLDVGYRESARVLLAAFAAAELPDEIITARYEEQLATTVLRTWDLGEALGLPYQPDAAIARRVLRHLTAILEPAQGAGRK